MHRDLRRRRRGRVGWTRLWDEAREREQWAEHSAGGTAAGSGAAGSTASGGGWLALAALVVPLTTGARSTRSCGSAGRSGSRRRPTPCATFWTWSCIAALVVGVITWGAMFWAMIFHRKRAGDVGRAAAPDAVQPARRDRLHGRPDDHRGGAVRLHRAGAEQRRRPSRPDAGPEGRRHRVPVELAVRLPGHRARRRARRSPRSARPTRSRCWCCPRTGPSSSPSAATT